jgi:uncharacterized membrane protein YvbJ
MFTFIIIIIIIIIIAFHYILRKGFSTTSVQVKQFVRNTLND